MNIQKDREDSCGDISLESLGINSHEETLIAKEGPTGELHPSPELLLIREAVKRLTKKQQYVWNLWNFDKLTQDEIAPKLNISQQAVSKRIKTIEKRISKWVKSNLGAYKLLKGELND